jgi:2'-5' RNA ligase
MLRLFLGIPLPPAHALQLSRICLGLHAVRWVDPGNFHVTIRFVGEVDEGVAADVDAEAAAIRSARFSLSVAGLGAFGPAEKPRTLIATLDRAPHLVQLHDRLGTALARAGVVPEARRFTPHVTLAHCIRPNPAEIQAFIAANNLLRLPPFPVDSFQLIRSYLTKAGSVYEEVARYPLV